MKKTSRKDAEPRRRLRDRRVRLAAMQALLNRHDWDERDLSEVTGVPLSTIRRMLSGAYIRKETAASVEQALRQYTTEPLFERPEAILEDSALESPPLASPLESLYRICELAPREMRDAIRIREFRDLIQDRTREFAGRKWLFDALDSFMLQSPHGYFVLTGQPGVGKTAFAAAVTERRGTIHHFTSRLTRLNRPDQFLQSVCAQLIAFARLPHSSLPARAGLDAGFFVTLLAEAARRNPGKRLLLVVDAVDESDPADAGTANPLCLPPRLPDGSYILVTTRDTDRRLRFESPSRTVYLEPRSANHQEDVRQFLRQRIEHANIKAYIRTHKLTAASLIDLLLERSQGNFMYLRYVLPEIEQGRYSDRDWRELPDGLANYYESHWMLLRDADRRTWYDCKLPILRTLATAPEPVSIELLHQRLPAIAPEILLDVLSRDWRQFLETVAVEIGAHKVTAWKLYHASFADFLRDKSTDSTERLDLDRERDAWFAFGRERGMTPD
jgi:hypothetical protein